MSYPITLPLLKKLGLGRQNAIQKTNELPTLSFVIAAYNEADCIRQKIENTLDLTTSKGIFTCNVNLPRYHNHNIIVIVLGVNFFNFSGFILSFFELKLFIILGFSQLITIQYYPLNLKVA